MICKLTHVPVEDEESRIVLIEIEVEVDNVQRRKLTASKP